MEKHMRIQVNVTQEAIDGSQHLSLCNCPLAKTINRDINGDSKIEQASVHAADGHCTISRMNDKQQWVRYLCNFELPTIARNFISTWDARKEVRPIEFELELVEVGERAHGAMSTR